MKAKKLVPILTAAVTLLSVRAAFADFTGSFTGLYAPANWVIAMSGNPTYDNTAEVIPNNSQQNVTFLGAVGTGTSAIGNPPYSIVDYSIVLDSGSVSFSYIFFNPGYPGDAAEVLDNGNLVTTLSSSSAQYRSTSGDFKTGDTLTLRLISVNNNLADVLEIAPLPEPSTLAVAGLGGAALLLQFRRKSAKR